MPETVHLTGRMAEELAFCVRAPLEFAGADPADQSAAQRALDETRQWLTAFHGVMPAPARRGDIAAERRVLGGYLERLGSVAPMYTGLIHSLAASLPDMTPDCRLSVNMPAYDEAAGIGQALGHMLVRQESTGPALRQRDVRGQTVDPAAYELTVVANRAEGKPDDGTTGAVREFRDACDLPLAMHTLDVVLPTSIANNGMARRIAHDVTAVRSLQRRQQTGVLYIGAEDADISGYDPQAFHSVISYLDVHPDKAAVRMRTERDSNALRHVPHVLIKHRFMTQLVTILRSGPFQPPHNPNYNPRFNRRVPSGYGTAFVSADLFGAGGFPVVRSSTDLLLGEQLAVLHGRDTGGRVEPAPHTVGASPAIVVASARRELVAYLAGVDPYQNGNFARDDLVQLTRLPMSEIIARAQQKDPGASREWLDSQIRLGMERIFGTAPSEARALASANFLMVACGFDKRDFTLADSTVGPQLTIRSWENVEQRARAYRPSARLQSTV